TADVEVEHGARLASGLTEVTAAARSGLLGRERAAERRIDPRRANGIVEQQLSEITLRFGRRITRVHRSIRLPGKRQIGVAHRNAQLLDATDLAIDEAAQLRAVSRLRRRDRVECER